MTATITMIWPEFQSFAQIAIGRFLNSLPEGLLIALFAGIMLRVLPRQNSGTRFAVWFVALLAVAGLPFMGNIAAGPSLIAAGAHPVITVPGSFGLSLFLAWALVTSVATLRLAIGLWRLRALRRSCFPIDGSQLDAAIRTTLADFASSRSVTLATSERMNVPAAIGFFKPMIVIPAWALRELTPAELNVILLHEFAHVRRGDAWTNLFQKIVRAVFLFHPAILWIESRLSLEREMACDDHVLAETANPRGYAKCLIALLEKNAARRGWAMAQAAVNRAREASLRLAQILDASRPDSKHVWKPALGLVSVFALICGIVVPRAPQFVAFEPNPRAPHAEYAHAVSLSQSHISAAAVIPASMRTNSSPSPKKMPQQRAAETVGHLREDVSEHRREHLSPSRPEEVMVARRDAGIESSLVELTAVSATQRDLSPSETVLIIRTTQQVGPNAWVWSVDVWRVTLLNAAQDRTENGATKAPAPKKT
jgi:beta-lactamase regulating signal transducer with metallopeptidase domain